MQSPPQKNNPNSGSNYWLYKLPSSFIYLQTAVVVVYICLKSNMHILPVCRYSYSFNLC